MMDSTAPVTSICKTWLVFVVCIILLIGIPPKSFAVLVYKIERIIKLDDTAPVKHDFAIHITEVNDFGFIAENDDAIQHDTQEIYFWDDEPSSMDTLAKATDANTVGASWNTDFPTLPTAVNLTTRAVGARNADSGTIDDLVLQPSPDDVESSVADLYMDDAQRLVCSATNLKGDQLAILLSEEVDADYDGLPDRWEMHYYGHLGVDLNDMVPCGSDVSNWEAFLLGINPVDYYHGRQPVLYVIEGGNVELNKQSDFKRAALTVVVTTWEGKVLAHAPVDFALATGGGSLCASADGSIASSRIRVCSNGDGEAKAWFLIAPTAPTTSTITVNAGTTTPADQVLLTEQTVDHPFPKSPAPPANLVEKVNPDGSRDLSWTNVANDAVCTKIRIRDQYGQWKIIGSVPANATSAHINPDGTLANKLP